MRDAALSELAFGVFAGIAVVAIAAFVVFRVVSWLGDQRREP